MASERSGRNGFPTGIFYRLVDNARLAYSMIRDYWEGAYHKMPFWTFASILLGVVYTLSPLDAVPDYIPGLGQIDDALVLGFCLLLLEKDLSAYRRWKMGRSA
ncbi:MAG: DUF1232 domain-containing protein [Deltaproteobacteria bacterium]|nr:DUF1232 domain-containing protein [Deltaproteobacteria bacterium]MBW2018052.1 DUF1232 domain-containing protein [Deltaproteobacteria bacterium]MBW2128973.1 DUF1232 domain-containing protein [Deltaproteobacteria bacterium]MBW2302932.1 DUF1232 domain-containing protein [Deltaproteobacteria bacterium]